MPGLVVAVHHFSLLLQASPCLSVMITPETSEGRYSHIKNSEASAWFLAHTRWRNIKY